jgi:1-acyl-sn-glycerol-3-phosphate acyltransferase
MTSSGIQSLIRINTDDMLEALGLASVGRGRRLFEWLCRPAARRFAEQVVDYDSRVGAWGLGAAARFLLEHNFASVEVAGIENLPSAGPLLLVANHPGLADAMAIFSCLSRSDLLTIAADRPFLRALEHTSKHLLYLRSEDEDQGFALRRLALHLRRGHSALIFPAGQIEPDPDLDPRAADSLENWSKSMGLIVRLVEGIRVVPVIVRGVLSKRAARHPLTRLRRDERDRERLGAMLQIILPWLRSVRIRVAFGEAMAGEYLLSPSRDAQDIASRITDRARRLIESPPVSWLPLSGVARAAAAYGRPDDGDLVASGDDFKRASL